MDIQSLLAKLKAEYLSGLPAKVNELAELAKQKNVSGLAAAFHKIKGSGKTYGLPAVSDIATLMEQICQKQPHQVALALPKALLLLHEISREPNLSLNDKPQWKELKSFGDLT